MRDVRNVLFLLWGGVGFVLVLGCVNIANLVVVRASGRAREMATRHAIGGDLARLARQLVTETTLLAVAGGALGVFLAWSLIRALAAANLAQLPRGYEIALDPLVITATLVLTVVVGLGLGIAPAVKLWRMKLDVELREETRGGTSGRRANLIRQALATAQVAIALALLTGAGLLLASFRAVLNLDYGFDPAQVATANISLPATAYKDGPALVSFESRMLEGLRAIPGVEAAGATSSVPFSNNINNSVILAEGYVMKPGESLLAPTQVTVSSGYFEAMHIPVVRGRSFEARDTTGAPTTAIIDERLARKFWPDQDAVGRRLYMPDDPKDITKITDKTRFFTIVGVVKEVQMIDPKADFTPVGTYYFPMEQSPQRDDDADRAARRFRPRRFKATSGASSRASIRSCRCIARSPCSNGSTTHWSAGACRCSFRSRSGWSRCCCRRLASTACWRTASRSAAASSACAWRSAGRPRPCLGSCSRMGSRSSRSASRLAWRRRSPSAS